MISTEQPKECPECSAPMVERCLGVEWISGLPRHLRDWVCDVCGHRVKGAAQSILASDEVYGRGV